MSTIFSWIRKPVSHRVTELVLTLMRIAIGLLAIGHGMPKFLGGVQILEQNGSAIAIIGIHVLPPLFWGIVAALIETCGGFALALGLWTRFSSLLLTAMMVVAFLMHWHKGDPFMVYSFSLTLIIVYGAFMILGGGRCSLDYYFCCKNKEPLHPPMQRPEDYL